MGKSLREKLKCEADIPDKAIRPLLVLYQQRVGRQSMDDFVLTVKRAKG